MRASQFIIFGLTTMVFSTFCDQSAQAGPLAEAVERAKAAAGVQVESAAEEQESPRDTAQPAMVPAVPENVSRNRRVSTISVAIRLPITGSRDTAVRAAILRQLDRL